MSKIKLINVGAEEFQSFKENHTIEWYEARHRLAQRFLDHFARRVGVISRRYINSKPVNTAPE